MSSNLIQFFFQQESPPSLYLPVMLQNPKQKLECLHVCCLQCIQIDVQGQSTKKFCQMLILCYKMYFQVYPYNQQNQIMSISVVEQRKSNLNAIRASFKQTHVLKTHLTLHLQSVALHQANSTQHSPQHEEAKTNSTRSETRVFKAIHDELLPQSCFFQTYEILQKIGEGCNASVYKCINKKNQQICAVKKVKIEEDHVLEFKRNFISIKQLNHPSFCSYRALYFGNRDRFAFLLMDYQPFPNLSQCVIQSEEQLKSITKQLISAIKYLHQQNICHRDIKPENILYDQKNGKVKIIDFGISKKTFLRGTRRDMLTIIGTNFYFAPEIYLGGGYDQQVDLWALGITIFKLITGYTPFQSEYHSQTISNILKGQADYSDRVWQNYSSFAKDFVQRLLKQRSKRMTLNQCQNHLWFQSLKKEKSLKMRRSSSFNLEISEDFRVEIKKHHQAMPKQEGAFSQFKLNTRVIPSPVKSSSQEEERESDFQDFENEEQIAYEMKHRKSF